MKVARHRGTRRVDASPISCRPSASARQLNSATPALSSLQRAGGLHHRPEFFAARRRRLSWTGLKDHRPCRQPTSASRSTSRASHVVLQVKDLPAAAPSTSIRSALSSAKRAANRSICVVWRRLATTVWCSKGRSGPPCRFVGFRAPRRRTGSRQGAFRNERAVPRPGRRSTIQRRTLHVVDPSGAHVEICANMDTRSPADSRRQRVRRACPLRLDHFQIHTPFVGEAFGFYAGMGFRLRNISPRRRGRADAVFLQRKGNPHDVVFSATTGRACTMSPFLARNLPPDASV